LLELKVPDKVSKPIEFYGFREREIPTHNQISHTRDISTMLRLSCSGLIVSALAVSAFAQTSGEVDFKTAIGSFKISSPGIEKARGKITMSFTGTLLLSDYKGSAPVFTGTVRKEYENLKEKKVVYFGKGTVTIDGSFRAVQWFGRDMSAKWVGMGICRLYGEFDKDGNTGTFLVKGDALRYWGSGGTTFSIPNPTLVRPKAPIIKRGG
jgi:hypothetical protein